MEAIPTSSSSSWLEKKATEHPIPSKVNPKFGGIVWRRKRMSRKEKMSGGGGRVVGRESK